MIPRPFLTICLSILLMTTNAQPPDYHRIDSFAFSVGKADSMTIAQLSTTLTTPFSDPVAKVRAIYTWIAYNIAYDCPAFHSESKRKGDPEIVYKQRKGVCEGYANLFQEMCSYANIQCVTIHGFARNGSDIYDNEDNPDEADHAWNAVRINGEWHLVDPTWSAGYTDKKVKVFTQAFNDAYFFPPPEKFILNHYPAVDAWRLCKVNLSKKRFFQNPVIKAGYLNDNINAFEPENKLLKGKANKPIQFSLTADNTENINNIRIVIGEGKKQVVLAPTTQRQDKKIGFLIQCPAAPNTAPLAIFINDRPYLIYQLEIIPE